MKYSVKAFREGLPDWKKSKDPLICRFIYRPISLLLSPLFCEIGMSANAVSCFSILVGVLACVLFCVSMPLIAALVLIIWAILDCVDGNIARTVRKDPSGAFFDAVSGYICQALLFACIGFYLYGTTGGLLVDAGNPVIIFVGSLASLFDILSRLVFQKYRNTISHDVSGASGHDALSSNPVLRIRSRLDESMSIGGYLPAVLVFATMFAMLDIIVLIWFFYYAISCIATVVYLLYKAHIMDGLDRS